MRIVIDLQCCQTAAQLRGIGRYSLALSKALLRVGSDHEFLFLLNAKLLPSTLAAISDLEAAKAGCRFVCFGQPNLGTNRDRGDREVIANLLRRDRIETTRPDVYHVSSLFEGDSIYGEAAPYYFLPRPPIITSGTIYDFIPALFPEQYLNNGAINAWYNKKLAITKQLDLLLTISGTTKSDAERLLGILPERIVNVSGSVDDRFRILPPGQRPCGKVWNRIDLHSPFVLYVGGPDFRKNLLGALEAFAQITHRIAADLTFVLVLDVGEDATKSLLRRAAELDIQSKVKITGFVDDDELVELYNACTLFIFPSLYEGLGLPVIEAMRCGAPVLVGDNSSLREIVLERRYRFDANSVVEIRDSMLRALSDPVQLKSMRADSVARAREFSWEVSARRSLSAWDMLHRERTALRSPILQKPRIAMFTPLPSERTGIADYAAELVPALSRHCKLSLFIEDVRSLTVHLGDVPIHHHTQFANCHQDFDAIVYQLGNSPFHHFMLPYIQRYPGVLVLHDAYLGHLTHDPTDSLAFLRKIVNEVGSPARKLIRESSDIAEAAQALIQHFPCAGGVIEASLGGIVHSNFAKSILMAAASPATGTQITVMPQFRAGIDESQRLDRQTARARLGLPVQAMIIGSFGHVASTKGILELIEAFIRCSEGGNGEKILVFVGELEGGREAATLYAQSVLAAIGDRSNIRITGFVSHDVYRSYLSAIDFGVQLRTVTRGETSRAMLDMLMNGIACIYNRLGAASELPLEVAHGIDNLSVKTLAAAMDRLIRDDTLRRAYTAAALSYARDELNEDKLAAAFVRATVEMAGCARGCGPVALARALANSWGGAEVSDDLIDETATAYVWQERSESRPRLLIDVTDAERSLRDTATHELIQAAYDLDNGVVVPQAFAFGLDEIKYADEFAFSAGAALTAVDIRRTGTLPIRFFDKMLLRSDCLMHGMRIRPVLNDLTSKGGSAFAIINDISAATEPELWQTHIVNRMAENLDLLLQQCAGLICTSQYIADSLINYTRKHDCKVRKGLRVGLVAARPRISMELDSPVQVSREIMTILQRDNVFILAGALQEQNQHLFALAAFDEIWQSNNDAALIFVKRRGWDVAEIASKILAHTQLGYNLFFLEPSDTAEVAKVYRKAKAAIILSDRDEGRKSFEEAVSYGCPLLLADMPALRQLAGEHARFCPVDDPTMLADAIRSSMISAPISSTALVAPQPAEFAREVLKFVQGSHFYYRF